MEPGIRVGQSTFFVSSNANVATRALKRDLLTRFRGVAFDGFAQPCVSGISGTQTVMRRVGGTTRASNFQPVVFSAVIGRSVHRVLTASGNFVVSVFSAFLTPLRRRLARRSSCAINGSRSVNNGSGCVRQVRTIGFTLSGSSNTHARCCSGTSLVLINISHYNGAPAYLCVTVRFNVHTTGCPLARSSVRHLALPTTLHTRRRGLFNLAVSPSHLATVHGRHGPGDHCSDCTRYRFRIHRIRGLFHHRGVTRVGSARFSIRRVSTGVLIRGNIRQQFG